MLFEILMVALCHFGPLPGPGAGRALDPRSGTADQASVQFQHLLWSCTQPHHRHQQSAMLPSKTLPLSATLTWHYSTQLFYAVSCSIDFFSLSLHIESLLLPSDQLCNWVSVFPHTVHVCLDFARLFCCPFPHFFVVEKKRSLSCCTQSLSLQKMIVIIPWKLSQYLI